MDFLPTSIHGKKPYAGFWIRLGAAIIDTLVMMLIIFCIYHLHDINLLLTTFLIIVTALLFATYNAYFNATFGGTLGKLASGIRVTKPNGHKISWQEAWYRSSIDLAFAALFLIIELWAFSSIEWNTYQNFLLTDINAANFEISNIFSYELKTHIYLPLPVIKQPLPNQHQLATPQKPTLTFVPQKKTLKVLVTMLGAHYPDYEVFLNNQKLKILKWRNTFFEVEIPNNLTQKSYKLYCKDMGRVFTNVLILQKGRDI
jgi:uncharacterized RDD family membrane protein YckC